MNIPIQSSCNPVESTYGRWIGKIQIRSALTNTCIVRTYSADGINPDPIQIEVLVLQALKKGLSAT